MKIASDFFSQAIIGELISRNKKTGQREYRKVKPEILLDMLREGKAGSLSLETHGVIADYIEAFYPKKKGGQKKGSKEFLSQEIIGELIEKETTEDGRQWRLIKPACLIGLLKGGKADLITQDTWNVVADYLETFYRKRQGGQEKDTYLRDKLIYRHYCKLRSRGDTHEGALLTLADQSFDGEFIGEKAIAKVVTNFNKEKKTILKEQNQTPS
jgi:hypothetical protein